MMSDHVAVAPDVAWQGTDRTGHPPQEEPIVSTPPTVRE
jgi:hypothetical protein